MKMAAAFSLVLACALAVVPSTSMAGSLKGLPSQRCAKLSRLQLPNTTVTEAMFVDAKPTIIGLAKAPGHRAFCKVVAHVRSAPDSDIAIELWLPGEGWQGVFHGNGNGGFAGQLSSGYAGMAEGLRRGYATAVTDAGTAPATPLEGDALIGHPRKWRDWGQLSTHVMTETGKAITRAFYGIAARRSLYTGCSTGGQQGLIEALYYPADYDGILVGAPVINRTWGHAAVLWDYAAAHRTPGSQLSPAKLKLLNRAAIATCWKQGHALAGDDFIADPLACSFDPAVIQCKAGTASDTCLTPAEVETARAFYSGPLGADGKPAYYGWLPGSEVPGHFGWSFLQEQISGQPAFSSLFKWVFGADWHWQDFEAGRDMAVVDGKLGPVVNNATMGSLRAFAARGGKLIMFHGLADTLVAPRQSIDWYESQRRELGDARMADVARLYLAPGVMHCGGGNGPDSFNATLGIPPRPTADDAEHDLLAALEDWTDGKGAPEAVIATRFDPDEPRRVDMQRPLCPYPQQARYLGVGSTISVGNFVCSE